MQQADKAEENNAGKRTAHGRNMERQSNEVMSSAAGSSSTELQAATTAGCDRTCVANDGAGGAKGTTEIFYFVWGGES